MKLVGNCIKKSLVLNISYRNNLYVDRLFLDKAFFYLNSITHGRQGLLVYKIYRRSRRSVFSLVRLAFYRPSTCNEALYYTIQYNRVYILIKLCKTQAARVAKAIKYIELDVARYDRYSFTN